MWRKRADSDATPYVVVSAVVVVVTVVDTLVVDSDVAVVVDVVDPILSMTEVRGTKCVRSFSSASCLGHGHQSYHSRS